MVPVFGIIAVAIVIFVIEVPALRRNRYIKELWFFSVLLLLGTGLSIVWALHVPLPSPLEWLTIVYKPLHDFIMRFLK
jgi:integral membrane sensor domain MASE1